MIVCGYPPSASNEGDQAPQPPTTRDLLLAAATVIHADGAGLCKRPDGVSYTNQGWRSMLDGPYPHENREITLTTTWSGTATNPFTGDTQTINGLVTTTETTGPFPLSHLVINNTDTWEEKQGH